MAKKKSQRGLGSIYRQPKSPNWYLCYSVDGKLFRESAKTTSETEATNKLKARIAEIAKGEFDGLKGKKLKVQELYDDLLRDYCINERRSIRDLEERWQNHLKPFFAHLKAQNVTTTMINRYVDKRQTESAANASINRELAILKRSFRLGLESTPPKITRVPHFEMLRENNVREGFVEDQTYEKLADHFATVGLWIRGMFEVAYTYGLRVGALKKMKVGWVDTEHRTLVFPAGSMKNTKPLTVQMTVRVYELLKECCEGKKADEPVFTRIENGQHKPILDFRGTWKNGCRAVGVPNLLFHDLRRTAARNLRRAGVAESVIMQIGNWLTRSVFLRYAIVDPSDIRDAVRKLEAFRAEPSEILHSETENETSEPVKARLTH